MPAEGPGMDEWKGLPGARASRPSLAGAPSRVAVKERPANHPPRKGPLPAAAGAEQGSELGGRRSPKAGPGPDPTRSARALGALQRPAGQPVDSQEDGRPAARGPSRARLARARAGRDAKTAAQAQQGAEGFGSSQKMSRRSGPRAATQLTQQGQSPAGQAAPGPRVGHARWLAKQNALRDPKAAAEAARSVEICEWRSAGWANRGAKQTRSSSQLNSSAGCAATASWCPATWAMGLGGYRNRFLRRRNPWWITTLGENCDTGAKPGRQEWARARVGSGQRRGQLFWEGHSRRKAAGKRRTPRLADQIQGATNCSSGSSTNRHFKNTNAPPGRGCGCAGTMPIGAVPTAGNVRNKWEINLAAPLRSTLTNFV